MTQQEIQQDKWKQMAGITAAMLVEDGMVIGLGSGSTAVQLTYALAQRIQEGLRIVGAVPTSKATEQLALQLDIPLTTLEDYPELDIDIDGADEIDGTLGLIKGGGGALLREKIVAASARRFVIIADITKEVSILGRKMPLPVEIIPFALSPVRKRLEALGASVALRLIGENVFITDNSNYILDCTFPGGILDALALQAAMKQIVGVVETGLFLHMAEQAIIGGPDGVKIVTAQP
ncbi:MAG: ribose-5-phosphate isomerase RpiA [Ktedonobacteraceae bacterium]